MDQEQIHPEGRKINKEYAPPAKPQFENVGKAPFISKKYPEHLIDAILSAMPVGAVFTCNWNFGFPSNTSRFSSGFLTKKENGSFKITKNISDTSSPVAAEYSTKKELIRDIKTHKVTFFAEPFGPVIITHANKKSLNPRGSYKMFRGIVPAGRSEIDIEFSDGIVYNTTGTKSIAEAKEEAWRYWRRESKKIAKSNFIERLKELHLILMASYSEKKWPTENEITELKRQLNFRQNPAIKLLMEQALAAIQGHDIDFISELANYGSDLNVQIYNKSLFLMAKRYGFDQFNLDEHGWYEVPKLTEVEAIEFRQKEDKAGIANKIEIAKGPNGKYAFGLWYAFGGGAGGGSSASIHNTPYNTLAEAKNAAIEKLKSILKKHENDHSDSSNYKPAYIKKVLSQIEKEQ